MQRLRILFSRGEPVKFISHLDITRLWQRALNRAGVSLVYSEGFNPHPRLSLAAPLALGITSEAELMDIYCTGMVSPHWFTGAVGQQLPDGIDVMKVSPVSPTLPALQAQVKFAEYFVEPAEVWERPAVEAAIERLLSLEELPWQHLRDTGPRRYDLRALVDDIWLVAWQADKITLGMRLQCSSNGSGRPEQVTAAVGFEQRPSSVHRTRLILGNF